jgi:hypothetical protein
MSRQIIRFSVHQTAKVLATIYFAMGLLFIPLFWVISSNTPAGATYGTGFALLIPVLYGLFGYCFVAIGCLIYNFIAGFVGGIEVEVRGDGQAAGLA